MSVKYTTEVIGSGNNASLHIPDEVLAELGANRRAPLKVTINNHTYQSTATAVGGQCRVVFPLANRTAARAAAGDEVEVILELDSGYREVPMPAELSEELIRKGLTERFESLSYSKRKEFARQVSDAKTEPTREKRIAKVIQALTGN